MLSHRQILDDLIHRHAFCNLKVILIFPFNPVGTITNSVIVKISIVCVCVCVAVYYAAHLLC